MINGVFIPRKGLDRTERDVLGRREPIEKG